MKDPDYDPDDESAYECFDCGTVIVAESNPEPCPECGTEMRNRSLPME